MLKAETNIVTGAGVILSGESFNPDTYKMPKKEVERLISIGAVSQGKSEREKDTATDTSAVDTDDHRKPADDTAEKPGK